MRKRIAIFGAVLVWMLLSAAACTTEEPGSAGRPRANLNAAAGDQGAPEAPPPSEEEQKRINSEIQKIKEEGILDENGQPAPGVDLNDYPGLG